MTIPTTLSLSKGPRPIAPRWATPRIHTSADPSLIDRVRAERARRALYANCDRAPLGWEKQSSLSTCDGEVARPRRDGGANV